MIQIQMDGDFSNLTNFLERSKSVVKKSNLDKYGEMGVEALKAATPVRTGKTADSWYYETSNKNGVATITFCNSNIQNGANVALILQYGHATSTGYWIEGKDYILPAIEPVLNQIAEDAWKEVMQNEHRH